MKADEIKKAILSAIDLDKEKLIIPEWNNAEFYIRAMTGFERDHFEQSIYSSNSKSKSANLENIRARLCALTMVDEDGNNVWTYDEAKELGSKNAKLLDKAFEVAQKLNGLRPSDLEELAGE